MEQHDFVAQVDGEIEQMRGENCHAALFHRTQQLLHLLRNDDVEGCQGFVKQQHGGVGDDVDDHLHFVLHALRIVLEQTVAVLRVDVQIVEILVDITMHGYAVGVDLKEKLEEFPSREKFRNLGCREHIADVFGGR